MGTLTYWGEFKSLPDSSVDEGTYTIELSRTVDGSSSYHEIMLGPNPINISWVSGGETIYSPIKASSATIQIVSDNYLENLFSTSATGTSVKLEYDYNNTITTLWKGYTQPNLFSAPYNHSTETYEIECYDGLSILEYFDYELATANVKTFITFAALIDKILTKCGCFTHWYFTHSIYLHENVGQYANTRNPLSKMTISEANFFNEDNEPMKMKEVMEEVCKFLGVTAVASGESVYFLNYDDLKRRSNSASFYEYTVGSPSSPVTTSVTVRDLKSISASTFAAAGATITVLGTYNKVTVHDSLYKVESIIPSLYENSDLANVKGYPWKDASNNDNFDLGWTEGFENLKVDTDAWCGSKGVSSDGNGHIFSSRYFDGRIKLYENQKYKSYYYNSSKNAVTPGSSHYTGTVTKSYSGYKGRSASVRVSNLTDSYAGGLFARVDSLWASGDDYNKTRADHSSYEWENYVWLNLKNYGLSIYQPLIESKPEWTTPFFISSNAFVVLKGSAQFDDRQGFPIPLNNYEENKDKTTMSNIKLYAKLQLGNKYYTGGGWGTSSTNWFTISLGEDQSESVHINGKAYDVKNSVDINVNCSDKGMMIRMPEYSSSAEYAIAAKPQLTIMARGQIDGDYRLDSVWLKDFDIIAHVPRLDAKDENDTDTEYTYEADVNSTAEFKKIEFKICTWDNKDVNYSAVAFPYSGNTTYKFVNLIHNEGLTFPDNADHRAEEVLAYRIVNQYTTPSKKLELILKNSLVNNSTEVAFAFKPWSVVNYNGSNWVVDAMENDVVNNRTTITLIEKK